MCKREISYIDIKCRVHWRKKAGNKVSEEYMISILFQIIILVCSLIILGKLSQIVLNSIEKILTATGVSEAFFGVSVLAIMTGLPEITVAYFSIQAGDPGLTIGDLFGSNVVNICLVLGIGALLAPLSKCCSKAVIELSDILLLISIIPLSLLVLEEISPYVGLILLFLFPLVMYIMNRKSVRLPKSKIPDHKDDKLKISVITLILGMVGIIISARFTVTSSLSLVSLLGIPSILFGAKIIALGTSLPELSIDLAAFRRGRGLLAMSEIAGSNLVNMTLVLGGVLLSSSLAINKVIFAQIIPFTVLSSLLLWYFLVKQGGIPQYGGIAFILIYVIFQAML